MSHKLSRDDKLCIAEIYRETNKTTTEIAEDWGVHPSTICRTLQNYLPQWEYEMLISKRHYDRYLRSR